MTTLSVNTSWFNSLYHRAIGVLQNLAEAALAAGIAPEAHDSQSSIRFYDNYSYFCRTLAEVINNMANDWDILNIWVNNIKEYDRDVSFLLNGVQGPVSSRYGANSRTNSFDDYLSQHMVNVSAASYEVDYSQSFASYASLQRLFAFKDSVAALDSSLEEYQHIISQLTACGYRLKGDFSDNVKDYMSQVHIRLIHAMRIIVSEFQNYIAEYLVLYLDSMHVSDYDYELYDVIGFYQKLEFVRNDLISSHGKVASFIESNRAYIPLQSLPGNEFEEFCSQINMSINIFRDIATNIRVAERRGKTINYDLWFDIMNLSQAGSDLSDNWNLRLTGYSNIDNLGNFNRHTSLIVDDGTPHASNSMILLELNSGNNTISIVARQRLRDRMIHDLIDHYVDRNVNFYTYDSYSGYDTDILRQKIQDVDFSDNRFCSNLLELYSTLVVNGFSSDCAMYLIEETMLYNADALKDASDINSNYEVLVTTAIREYVTDYCVYIADHPEYGYCQVNRWNGDFDCASLIITAYEKAGVRLLDLENSNDNGPACSSFTDSQMEKFGFVLIYPEAGDESAMIAGDLMVQRDNKNPIYNQDGSFHGYDYPSHAQLYFGNSLSVSANVSDDVFRGPNSNTAFRLAPGDNLQGKSYDSFDKKDPYGDYYTERFLANEKDFITDMSNCTDKDNHDRGGEIRVEYTYIKNEDGTYSWTHLWDSYYRFDNLNSFKSN